MSHWLRSKDTTNRNLGNFSWQLLLSDGYLKTFKWDTAVRSSQNLQGILLLTNKATPPPVPRFLRSLIKYVPRQLIVSSIENYLLTMSPLNRLRYYYYYQRESPIHLISYKLILVKKVKMNIIPLYPLMYTNESPRYALEF